MKEAAIIAFPCLSPYFSFTMNTLYFYRPRPAINLAFAIIRHGAILLLLFASAAPAQFMRNEPRQDMRAVNPVMVEAVSFWADDTSSIDLIVQYRINPTFLFFTKSEDNPQHAFEARGELMIEVLDENGVTVTRAIRPLQIERSSLMPEGSPQHRELQGAFSFHVKNRTYKINLEAKDFESGKTFVNRDIRVDARMLSLARLNMSHAILVEAHLADTTTGAKEVAPVNHENSFTIGQNVGYFFQVYTPDTAANLRISWRIEGKGEASSDSQRQFSGERCIEWSGVPMLIEKSGNIFYGTGSDSRHSRQILVLLPSRRLEEGMYSFNVKVTQDTLKLAKEFTFFVNWPGKPRSLSDLRLAIDALRHIATEEQISQISSLNTEKATRAFHEFWKKKNPDSTSAYNPVMAEYYRRVDETIRRYSPENELTGYRTDRGRIYILFGPPTKMDRSLKPNMPPTETWTYENLKRRFIFTDPQKTGTYSLVQAENY